MLQPFRLCEENHIGRYYPFDLQNSFDVPLDARQIR